MNGDKIIYRIYKSQMLEYAAILLTATILIFGILYKSGSLRSGYHLLDDHELIRIEYSLQNSSDSIGRIIAGTISNDLASRFRPFYWVERIGLTAVMGSNLNYWNLYKGIQGVLTFVLLYFTSRKLRNSWHISFLFAAIIMLGTQFTPWFRSANQENTGLFLSALILFMISGQYGRNNFHNIFYNILIGFCIIICGLVKESFTLMIPAFAALKIFLEYCRYKPEDSEKINVKICLMKNAGFLSATGFSFLINVYFIVFKIGADKVSYAGFHKESKISDYFYGIRDSLNVYLKWYYITGIILILMIIMCYQLIYKNYIKYYLGILILGCYIMGVQLVAHAKSLMWERYIIPFILGYAIVFILLGYYILKKDRFRRRVYEGVLIVLLLLEAPRAYAMSKDYAYGGEMIQNQFQTVLEFTQEDSLIIGAYKDMELNIATSCWLEVNGRTKEYSYDWTEKILTDTAQLVQVTDNNVSWADCDAAMCYNTDTELVLTLMGLPDSEDVQIFHYGNYTVIIRS